jgi:hypothetical protein
MIDLHRYLYTRFRYQALCCRHRLQCLTPCAGRGGAPERERKLPHLNGRVIRTLGREDGPVAEGQAARFRTRCALLLGLSSTSSHWLNWRASHQQRRLLCSPGSVDNVWWGPVNIKLSEQSFMINRERAIDYLNTRERIYVVDGVLIAGFGYNLPTRILLYAASHVRLHLTAGFAGWDPKYRVRVRVICVRAYHALFMRNMVSDRREAASGSDQTG